MAHGLDLPPFQTAIRGYFLNPTIYFRKIEEI
jgi:hypothetical protein